MITQQVPEYIRSLIPYLPGKPIEETQREYNLKRVVKLASNENPLGPSPKAVAAVKSALKEMHRYPDGAAFHLKRALSKKLETQPQTLIIGNGSNELIDMVIRTFCVVGDAIVTSQAAFIAYRLCAQIHGVKTVETALTADLKFDLGAILEKIKTNPKIKLAFIPNPNNPTGTYLDESSLRTFIAEVSKVRGGSVLVVLDYAYWEYVTAKDLPDPHKLLMDYPENILILRTFSKVYGLAGLRVGYAIASPEVIVSLEKVRQPFNLNSLALAGAEAALGDQAFVKLAKKANSQGMKFWESSLKKLSIPFWKAQGNFLLINTQEGLGRTGVEVFSECIKKGVILRPVANYGLPHALRISIGKENENKFALKVLQSIATNSGGKN